MHAVQSLMLKLEKLLEKAAAAAYAAALSPSLKLR
jgi:hypothetical protein